MSGARTAEGSSSPTSSRRPLWRDRDFSLLWVGETISVFGTTTSSVLLPLLAVTGLGASAWWVGLLTAATWLP